MKIEMTNGTDERFIKLCAELDDYLNEAVGVEKQQEQYVAFNTLEEIHDVVLAIDDGVVIGTGSFKQYDDHVAEVKRVFVKEAYRKQGVAKRIMEALEKQAKEKGYDTLILETGAALKGAIHLYKSIGFERIVNYGQYVDMPESICMEKQLAK
ncbi:MAG: GNAT family N-acetyltransferase [Cellulosilyticum sp.]|nr:GNAT family N-acetyltransferase [Cellulosilyticum sp.]